MRRTRRIVGTVGMFAVAALLPSCGQNSWQSELVSVDKGGIESGNGRSGSTSIPGHVAVSPDGTRIAFESEAFNLGVVDTNGVSDIYLRDLTAGTTTLVSANADRTDSGNGMSGLPVFSPDGTRVAFNSQASNLGPNDSDTPGAADSADVYMYDLANGETTLVSVNGAGTDSAEAPDAGPVFSPDGNRVAFTNWGGRDLGPIDSNFTMDVYIRDLGAGVTTLVSANAAGTDSGNGTSSVYGMEGIFTPDGTKVLFTSDANNLGPNDSPRVGQSNDDVYLRDLTTGTTTLVSRNAAGTDSGNGTSWSPILSPDGTKIAFSSRATDLGPIDDNTRFDIYVRDLVSGMSSLVSVNTTGQGGGDRNSLGGMVFSPDSSKLAFTTPASNLVPVDTNLTSDVFLRDLVAGTTTLLSPDAAGTDSGNNRSIYPRFSPNGKLVSIISDASNLGPTDSNERQDVYVRDLAAGAIALVSINPEGTDSGNDHSSNPIFTPDNRILFSSLASNLGPPDDNAATDIFLATLRPLKPPPPSRLTASG